MPNVLIWNFFSLFFSVSLFLSISCELFLRISAFVKMNGKPNKHSFVYVSSVVQTEENKCLNENSYNDGDETVPLGLTGKAVCMQVNLFYFFNIRMKFDRVEVLRKISVNFLNGIYSTHREIFVIEIEKYYFIKEMFEDFCLFVVHHLYQAIAIQFMAPNIKVVNCDSFKHKHVDIHSNKIMIQNTQENSIPRENSHYFRSEMFNFISIHDFQPPK